MATSGDIPMATREDFFMATDSGLDLGQLAVVGECEAPAANSHAHHAPSRRSMRSRYECARGCIMGQPPHLFADQAMGSSGRSPCWMAKRLAVTRLDAPVFV